MKMEAPTDESVIKTHMFGYCQYASRDLDKHKCPGMFQRYFNGKIKQGRKNVDGLVYIDEWYRCSCLCHIPEEERPKPKAKRTRKKAAPKTRRKK